ncbi:hypothetical protein C8Q75DRAFT_862589 [Abortiporus biennis]|nr:hypothetical protein C8Q75DRAFT_862589 [Abortiporus biennis]
MHISTFLEWVLLHSLALSTHAAFVSEFRSEQNAFKLPTARPLDSEVKVPVTLGVMSRCPDAIYCESVFDEVLKETNDKIDLSLTFIGRINASEPDYGVTCMHGPWECAGNVQELCAVKYESTETWWNFVQCQNAEGRYQVGLPEVAKRCADVAGIDWNGITGACAGQDHPESAGEGIELLKKSVLKTTELGVTKSCTILINNKAVCVHDETWKDCEGGHAPEDFIRQINDEYEKLNARSL